MRERVSIVRCQTYEEEEVFKALQKSLDFIGGIRRFVKQGDQVLLKPNLLYGKAPEKAVTTHPAIVKGMVRMVQEAGGKPFIGDSPSIGGLMKTAERAGIKEVAEEMGCPLVEFNNPVSPSGRRGSFFKSIEIDQSVLDADVVINLPKWKTHAQMLLTLGVKNLFGCIPGARKALWHLKAGEDQRRFAQVLVDLYQIISPSLTVLDGVIGMEGNGPNSGRPISLGLILSSTDALSLDQVVCDLLGLPRLSLMTNRVALEAGLGSDEIEMVGERIEEVRISKFELPKLSSLNWGLPDFLKRLLKNTLSSKPVLERERCKKCGQCVESCPPRSLSLTEKGPAFDYGQCIRCFCCQEVCPEGAIHIEPGWALRWYHQIRGTKFNPTRSVSL